jgi:hypothetical protein
MERKTKPSAAVANLTNQPAADPVGDAIKAMSPEMRRAFFAIYTAPPARRVSAHRIERMPLA